MGSTSDIAIQQATVNLLADMAIQPQSLQPNLIRAFETTDLTAPTAIIVAPAAGAVLTVGNTVSITGTATDVGGVVAAIEVSVDGGNTWNPATGTSNWSYTWVVTGPGSVTIMTRAVDDSGNLQSSSSGVSVTSSLAPTSTTGLVASYGFNEGSGTNLTDLSGNGNNGTISNATWTTGINGGALAFNGTNSWVTINDANSLDLTTGLTFEAWIKPSADASDYTTVLMKERTGGMAYGLYGSRGNAQPPAAVIDRNSSTYAVNGTTVSATGTWTFLAASYDGNDLKLYVNGTQVDGASIGDAITSSDGALRIGGNSTWGEYFNGLIDEIRIYNRALNPSEVYRDMITPVGTTQADSTPPTGSISTPTSGSTKSGVTTLTATAADNLLVGGVQFLLDGQPFGSMVTTAPYSLSWDTSKYVNGSHVISARITDKAGNSTTTAGNTVTVSNAADTTLPTVNLLNPANSTLVHGTVVSWAVATDNLGVASVQFQLNGSNLGSPLTTSPYRLGWDSTAVPDGQYTLAAIARDAAGNSRTSSVTVTVDNTHPTVMAYTPVSGTTDVPTAGTHLTMTFSEPVTPGTLSFKLLDPNQVAYPGTISFDASNQVATFIPSTVLEPSSVYTAIIAGVEDGAGNNLQAPVSWTFETSSLIASASIFSPSATPIYPSASDTDSVELGVRFYSDIAGYISGIRFFKGAGNTGTHVAHLWTQNGALLGSATFTDESATGWQQANFAIPIAIAANTTYIASYFAPAGHYAADQGELSNGITTAFLHVLPSSPSAGNGVYVYTPTGGYPSLSFGATNYWVDVAFTNSLASLPLTIVSKSPAAGATGVSITKPLTATFNKPVQPGSLQFTLKDSGGNVIPAALSYNAASFTAILTPSSPLAELTTYTATITGATDLSGNVMSSVSWSLTTVADAVGPTVVFTTPVSAESGVALGSVISATFSEAVNPASISFFLEGPDESILPSSLSYDSITHTVTLIPSTPLDHSTEYEAELTAAQDLAGNPMAMPVTWEFETESGIVVPQVVAKTPAAGATGVSVASVVTVKFNEPVVPGSITFTLVDSTNHPVTTTLSYNTTTNVATLDPHLSLVQGMTYTATISGIRDSIGNVMASPVSWSFSTNDFNTLWPSGTVPAHPTSSDTLGVELGVKFRSDVAGSITGIRFYKGTGNTGTHVGHLWTASGTLLATATFSGESATGWQQVSFSTPVAITPDTVYVASYYAPVGGYAYEPQFFVSSGFDSAPLHALANGASGGNGLYGYGAAGTFPTGSFNATNYWVDVVFAAQGSASVAPTVTSVTPGPSATNVPVSTKQLVATFSTGMDSISTFTLMDSTGSSVSGSIQAVAGSNSAVFLINSSVSLNPSTVYTATVYGMDTTRTPMAAPYSWTFTTAAAGSVVTSSLWSNTVVPTHPTSSDTLGVELGVKFRSDVAGSITGIRFYKGTGNTGTHVGHLWTASGTLLATATFSGESATGWQQVSFSTPVAITPDTVYVASYYAPVGGYAYEPQFFVSSGFDSAPLHALANGASGGNGLYGYGAAGTFPTGSFNATNYWVDVVFTSGATSALSVTGQAPAPNAGDVPVSTQLTATFSADVQPASIAFTLKDSTGTTVPLGTVNYNATTKVATVTPSSTLANATTYTATVSATDTSGGAMASPFSWTFTTVSSGGGPYTLWNSQVTPQTHSGSDTSSLELGVKFRSDVAGTITGIRFYKGAGNTGTHVGHLWDASGNLLATATFSGETASGWQQVNFATPVTISANTMYVASYSDSGGHYAYNSAYFATSGVDNGPLHAPSTSVAGGNGVYGTLGGFPTSSYNATNYWVDLVFNQGPVVVSQSPAPNAPSVDPASAVTVTFSTAMILPGTLSFVLKDANGVTVSATYSYPTSTTAVLTPSTSLTSGVTYTVTISGASDTNGTPMLPNSWSFTVSNGSTTIWGPSTTPTNATANDPSPVELGVKFRSDVAGTITGIRFYKGAGNTGTHVGHLWDASGNLLATATFSGETASGWQQVNFATPVTISANVVYIGSYFAPVGGYSYNSGYFASSGANNGTLHALANGVSGGNGLYGYGPVGTFPTGSFNATNYWVDVVFSNGATFAALTASSPSSTSFDTLAFSAEAAATPSDQSKSTQKAAGESRQASKTTATSTPAADGGISVVTAPGSLIPGASIPGQPNSHGTRLSIRGKLLTGFDRNGAIKEKAARPSWWNRRFRPGALASRALTSNRISEPAVSARHALKHSVAVVDPSSQSSP